MNVRVLLAVAVTASMLAGSAHAGKQVCDTGNRASGVLCILALVPVAAVGAAVAALTPDPPDKAAAKAIQSGNVPQLEFILQTHPQLLKDTEKAHRLLLAAAQAGNVATTRELLDADVSRVATGNCKTPLDSANQMHNAQMISLLQSAGAVAHPPEQAACHAKLATATSACCARSGSAAKP